MFVESWGRPDWASKDGSNSTDGRGQWGGGRGRYGGDRGFRGGSGGAWNSRMRQLINSNSTLGMKARWGGGGGVLHDCIVIMKQ